MKQKERKKRAKQRKREQQFNQEEMLPEAANEPAAAKGKQDTSGYETGHHSDEVDIEYAASSSWLIYSV